MAKKRPKNNRHFIVKDGCPFEAARAISAILKPFTYPPDRLRVVRWALEHAGYGYPIRIESGDK